MNILTKIENIYVTMEDTDELQGNTLFSSNQVLLDHRSLETWRVDSTRYSSYNASGDNQSVGSSVLLVIAGDYDLEVGYFQKWLA